MIHSVSETYGWSCVPMLLAALCLLCLPLAALMRKPEDETVEEDLNPNQTTNCKDLSYMMFVLANLPAIMAQYIIFAFLPKVILGVR